MGYALIKINTSDHMQLCREPSLWSWAMLCGEFSFLLITMKYVLLICSRCMHFTLEFVST